MKRWLADRTLAGRAGARVAGARPQEDARFALLERVRDPAGGASDREIATAVLEAAMSRLEAAQRDALATADREASRDLRAATTTVPGTLLLARAVEGAAERLLAARYPGRALRANVEFYTATLLDAVGLPRDLFSATFAAARTAGWFAHVVEQRAEGRLIRPEARYVGPQHDVAPSLTRRPRVSSAPRPVLREAPATPSSYARSRPHMTFRALLPDLGLLVLRLGLGGVMLTHGFQKLSNYDAMLTKFADPFGFGITLSVLLAIFAELFCSLGIMLGLATRLAAIPLIVTMATAFFIIHGNDPMMKKELALIYLIGFVALLLTGPGRISVDHLIAGWWQRRKAAKRA